MKNTHSLVLTGLMIAIGLVLPPVVRMIPEAGVWLSPMHIPVLIAGMTIGPVEGLITGIVCPVLNNILFGMPMGSTLIGMCVELPVYGLVSGLLMKGLNHRISDGARVYLSLIIAMVLGRIAGGVTQAVVLGAGKYTLAMWASSYFLETIPAIIVQLILIPAVYFALKRAKLSAN